MAKQKKKAGTRAGKSRRGKGESMTGSKEGQVEVRTVELGLANIELDERDVKTHIRAIKAAKEKKDTAVSLLRGAKKAANQLHPELATEIEFALTQERKDDPKKLIESLQVRGLVLKANGSTIQLNVFDTLAGDQKELVARRGYEDGKAGRSCDNPYPEASDLARIYAKNWRKGQADNLNLSGEQFEQAEAERDDADSDIPLYTPPAIADGAASLVTH